MRSPLAHRRLSRPPCRLPESDDGQVDGRPLGLARVRCLLLAPASASSAAAAGRFYIFGNAVLGADHARLGFPRRQASRCRSGARLVLGRKVQDCPYRCVSRLRTVCCGQFSMPPPWLSRDSLLSASTHQRCAPKRFFPLPYKRFFPPFLFLFLLFIKQGLLRTCILAGIPSLVLSFLILFLYPFSFLLFFWIFLTIKLSEKSVYENQQNGQFFNDGVGM